MADLATRFKYMKAEDIANGLPEKEQIRLGNDILIRDISDKLNNFIDFVFDDDFRNYLEDVGVLDDVLAHAYNEWMKESKNTNLIEETTDLYMHEIIPLCDQYEKAPEFNRSTGLLPDVKAEDIMTVLADNPGKKDTIRYACFEKTLQKYFDDGLEEFLEVPASVLHKNESLYSNIYKEYKSHLTDENYVKDIVRQVVNKDYPTISAQLGPTNIIDVNLSKNSFEKTDYGYVGEIDVKYMSELRHEKTARFYGLYEKGELVKLDEYYPMTDKLGEGVVTPELESLKEDIFEDAEDIFKEKENELNKNFHCL